MVNRGISYIEPEEMQEHLIYCNNFRKFRETMEFRKYNPDIDYISVKYALVWVGLTRMQLTYKKGTKARTYECNLDGKEATQKIVGSEAFRIASQYYKVPRREANFSASPLLWKNDQYEGQRVQAISYDLNSAYAWAMIQDIPDTSQEPKSGVVRDKEIGFSLEGELIKEGKNAMWIFPLIESPLKGFVKKWFNKKRNAKTKEERDKAKNVLVYFVGCLQKYNPFLRSYIVNTCTEKVKSLIDENTLYCNTDSITSLKPIEGLEIGSDIGQWKIEHEGLFAFVGFNYQWNDEIPSYRHISKKWFPKGWDILKDEIPNEERNTIKYNKIEHLLYYNK